MCGFFQVIQRTAPIHRDRFRAALQTMQHRGPDAQGEHFAEIQPAQSTRYYTAFGHQRLSILDLSTSSNQPFRHQQHTLLYNGEVYNFKKLAQSLNAQGVSLTTQGDTEVVMHSLIHQGADALSTFNGMWAFSLFHAKTHQVMLSRDRYGKKPLFIYQDENTFCASSTIRAIKVYLDLKLSFRRQKLLDLMLFGTLYPSPSGQTHFENISHILPGHVAFFDCANWSLHQTPYFDPAKPNQSTHDKAQSADLIATLSDSVAARLISDRPVGLLLSGGIDSSLLLSIMVSKGLQDQVNIFMGDTGRSEDYAYAKKSVEQLGLKAETVRLDYDDNTFERFLKICWHHEKPFPLNGNAMAMPQMYEAVESQGIPVSWTARVVMSYLVVTGNGICPMPCVKLSAAETGAG